MNVLIIGSGGREYALYWRIKRDSDDKVYVLPGNGGIPEEERLKLDWRDFNKLYKVIRDKSIDFVVVGPEEPLVLGIGDFLREKGVPVFGPNKDGALLEGSKAYAKDFMKKYSIPTAFYETFDNPEDIKRYVEQKGYPIVLKASGLAAGKGVIIVNSYEELDEALDKYFVKRVFGEAGKTVVVEEYLSGYEVSVFVIPEGERYFMLPLSQDHKRIYEGDKGPNTGGMGAYAPVPIGEDVMTKIKEMIVEPTLEALRSEEIDYRGVLYIGLMIKDGDPYVLEYNCRFGDPEAQVILPLIGGNFLDYIYNVAIGSKSLERPKLINEYAIGVVLASEGYPGSYEKGYEIKIDTLPNNSLIFFAGVERKDGRIVTSGGRVLTCVNTHQDFWKAREMVYEDIKYINFDNKYYRKDIGYRMKDYLS